MPKSRPGSHAPQQMEEVTAELLRGWPLPRHADDCDKEGRGRVLVVGGSPEMPGAVLLAATAALRAGAGKLQVATCASVAPLLAAQLPEARVIALPETRAGGIVPAAAHKLADFARGASAVLIGPGMIDGEASSRLVQELAALAPGADLLLDALGMECLRDSPSLFAGRPGTLSLTPHAGELAHLFDRPREQVLDHAAEMAQEGARRFSGAVALKGSSTWLADRSGRALCHKNANPGLGTSGSGDTLAGIAAGLLARGASPLQALTWAVFLHARAGEVLAARIGPLGFLARELPAEIPRLMELGPRSAISAPE